MKWLNVEFAWSHQSINTMSPSDARRLRNHGFEIDKTELDDGSIVINPGTEDMVLRLLGNRDLFWVEFRGALVNYRLMRC